MDESGSRSHWCRRGKPMDMPRATSICRWLGRPLTRFFVPWPGNMAMVNQFEINARRHFISITRLGSASRWFRKPASIACRAKFWGCYRMAPSTLGLSPPSRSSVRVTRTWVVSMRPEIEAALRKAFFTTFAGSMTPALYISTYSPVTAL